MKCEDVGMLLKSSLDQPDSAERRRVIGHLMTCDDCQLALRAVKYLHAEQYRPIPEPRPGALDRALRAATKPQLDKRSGRGGFWAGLAVGISAAAGIAIVSTIFFLAGNRLGGDSPPEVTIALHETRDVRIAIDAREPLPNANVHVMLRGAVDLLGFEGQRDIRWSTDLERGVNELTLPVVAFGKRGGQILVEVQHGNKRKTFLVDVRTGQPG